MTEAGPLWERHWRIDKWEMEVRTGSRLRRRCHEGRLGRFYEETNTGTKLPGNRHRLNLPECQVKRNNRERNNYKKEGVLLKVELN